MNPTFRQGSRLRILLRVAAYAVLVLTLVYLVAANLILNAGLMSLLLPKPERMLVEIGSGWTVVPGFIHIEDFRVRGQTKTMQWQGRLGEADVRISLLDLISRKVEVRGVRGTGFDFRLRPRLSAQTASLPEARFYPEIEGLSNPPDPAPEDIYPPKVLKKKFGWHIDIANMEFGGPIEVWMGRARLSGIGSVSGAFEFVIRGDLELPTARFDLERGEIVFDEELLVQKLDISTDISLAPFRPKEVKGLAVMNQVLGTFELKNGEIPNLRVVNAFLPHDASLRFESGVASFSMSSDKPSVEAGSGGIVEIGAVDADLRLAGKQVFGNVDLSSRIVRGSLAETRWEFGETALALDNLRLAEDRVVAAGDEDEVKAVEGWWAKFRIKSGVVDLGHPTDVDVTMELELKNTKPLLALFFGKEGEEGLEFPLWVKLLPDISNVKGVGSFDLDANGTILDDIVLTGDKFLLLARMAANGDVVDGAAYVRYKGLDIGVGLKDGKRNLKLFRPKKWFLSQLELDDTSQLVLRSGCKRRKPRVESNNRP